MKKFILLFSILFLYNVRAQWVQMIPVPHSLMDIFFTDLNHGFLVGSDGAIFGTTDAGITWSPKDWVTLQWLTSIQFVNSNVGIVAGNTGTILKTTDGGNTWNHKSSPTDFYLSCVSFCDQLNGYITGERGLVMRTGNGGETWSIKNTGTTNTLRACAAIFPWLCYAVGENGIILKTTTGGTQWTSLNSGTTNELYGVSFLNSSIGMAVGVGGTILKTTNGGTTWTLQNSGEYTLRAVYMINPNKAVACGTDGTILRTKDGGVHWNSQTTGTGEMITGIFFTDVIHGYAVGTGGVILKTIRAKNNKNIELEFNNVLANKTDGSVQALSPENFKTIVSVEEPTSVPAEFSLSQNYPNPFNPATTIKYELPEEGHVSMKLYNALGTEISTLLNEHKQAGSYEITFNAIDLPSGVYIYIMKANRYTSAMKMLILK